MNLVPMIVDKEINGERSYDIFSKLLKNRIIILSGTINDESANTIVAELLYLDSLNHEDISLYINSPGGSVTAGFAIYDTMNLIKSDVSTICMGLSPEFCSSANSQYISKPFSIRLFLCQSFYVFILYNLVQYDIINI